MKTLTNLTLTNLRKNRSRTIMTIIGVALSVGLILACIGFYTSLVYSERMDAILRFGDYHVVYVDVPGDAVEVAEKSSNYEVKFYSEHVSCLQELIGYDCDHYSPFTVDEYDPIYDSNELIRDKDHKYNVFMKYKNAAKADYADDRLLASFRDAGVEEMTMIKNSMLAYFDGDVPETTNVLTFWFGFLFIGAMSIIAAFVIRNSFNISITERVRQFGMLKSVGARPKQIRRMVYQEGLFVGLVAIPLGIGFGCLATLGVVAAVNSLVGFSEVTDMLFNIPLSSIGIVSLAGLFIIFLSASSPAIVASRVSPIAALRNTQDIKVKPRKLRTSKLTEKMWGIGGVIAAKNLKRSRSKYRTTVISIVMSVAVYIGISSFMAYGHAVIDLFYEDTGANVTVSANRDEIFDDVIKRFDVKKYAIYHSYSIVKNVDDENYVPLPEINVISQGEFERYAREAGIRSSDYNNLAILQDSAKDTDFDGNLVTKRVTDYSVGDEISFSAANDYYNPEATAPCDRESLFTDKTDGELDEDDLETIRKCESGELVIKGVWERKVSDLQHLKITNITDKLPIGVARPDFYSHGTIYISENHPIAVALKDFSYPNYLHIADSGIGKDITEYLTNEDVLKKYQKEYGEDVSVFAVDYEEMLKSLRNTILLFEIIIYGFIIIAALIGVTNIFNTITTNVALRSKEFAVLKSVGMTENEFDRMIRLETVMYTVRALLIGLPVGLLMSYGVFKLFDESTMNFGWLIPWNAIAICVVVVAALIALIMHYSVRKIKKQNIIETIRKESF